MKLKKILKKLDKYVKVAWDNSTAFLATFSKCDTSDLVDIRFSGHKSDIQIVYIIDSGQHVIDHVKIKDFVKFYEEYKGCEEII